MDYPLYRARPTEYCNENMEVSKSDKIISTTVSRRLSDGRIVELVYSPEEQRTRLAIKAGGDIRLVHELRLDTGETLVPVSASNNLVKHRALVLAEKPEPYGSTGDLIADIQEYLHRYVDLTSKFEKIVSYYVLLTWVYDAFKELPYLRLRGDFGSGKTRGLLVIGSLCYKGFFASGASTVSPIFNTLETFRGTLIFDEADFRFSDEKSELVKIFNNGNVRGFPVLRTAMTAKREFDPRAFHVFGPKIMAMRRSFEDQALETRFLTEEMGNRSLRSDIPINLPDAQADEARALRNRLLTYRFRSLQTTQINESLVNPSLSARLNQILIPLLSIIDDEGVRREIQDTGKSFDQDLYAERSTSPEAGVLEVVAELFAQGSEHTIPLSKITAAFIGRFGAEHERPVTNRYVGGILRKRLRLLCYKSHGVYAVPVSEKPKVDELCIRYGVSERRSAVDKQSTLV